MIIIEELNLYANAKFAKFVAFGLVVFFICYHGFLHAMDGGDSCLRLLSDGRFQGSLIWQPYGCMLHSYSNTDSRRCMRYVAFMKENNHFAFIGDSRIRQLYYALVKQVSIMQSTTDEKVHADLHYNDTDLLLKIDYFWMPNMDDNALQLLNKYKYTGKIPKLIVLGSGTHSIKSHNASIAGFEEYKMNLSSISSILNYLGAETNVLWMLQDPVVPERLVPARAAITNDQIDMYNKAAMEIFGGTKVQLWSSSRLIAQGSLNGFSDGLHAGSVSINYNTQILLNLYCNDHLNYQDGTCCSSREVFNYIQIAVIATLCTCSCLMTVVAFKQWMSGIQVNKVHLVSSSSSSLSSSASSSVSSSASSTSEEDPLQHNNCNSNSALLPKKVSATKSMDSSLLVVCMALGKLGLIMGYFFLCDRTNLFMKENKYYTNLNFWLPLGYVFALGLFFTEDTSHTRVLHRDLTNEWKGWMQLVILIYHMTGASQVLPIYMHVRILVSSYLFLTGYGHFAFYWQGQDVGIARYCQVMFRLNFLTIVLCLLMNRPYQFYYYVPLVSFWYTVMHVTLILPPRLNRPCHSNSDHSPFNYFYCIIKLLCLGSVITVLYLSEVFFERIFVMRVWKALFVTTDDDIHEWWFRSQLDRYSLLYGMVFGLLYFASTQYKIFDDKSGSNLLGGRMAFLVSLLSFFFVGFYGIVTYFCTTKSDCNEVHPYVVWVPVLGYIVLRNILGSLRTRYSSFFAWFGKISLELFVCQYHIWLAADTHGILVLIPSYPVANILVTFFIFLCAAHEIHNITNVLVNFFAPYDTMKSLRNLILFFCFLLVIGLIDRQF